MWNLINYLFIGTLFTMVVDISTWYAIKKGVVVPEGTDWNWTTRILAIIIWPIGVIYFIVGFIYQIIKQTKK